jgi:intracellular sulfur oxidation DsrE/DsrF family protein
MRAQYPGGMKNKVILVTSDEFGTGEPALGRSVLETFFVLVKQRADLPAAIFCMNRGVFALTNKSFASVHLGELAAAGVPVYACSTCVEHYGVKDDLNAGEISSMAAFVELASQHEVLTIA